MREITEIEKPNFFLKVFPESGKKIAATSVAISVAKSASQEVLKLFNQGQSLVEKYVYCYCIFLTAHFLSLKEKTNHGSAKWLTSPTR